MADNENPEGSASTPPEGAPPQQERPRMGGSARSGGGAGGRGGGGRGGQGAGPQDVPAEYRSHVGRMTAEATTPRLRAFV
ncbi:MAG: hypothetical protein M3365_01490, partial [Gemmatimonadota bacterium]|nr:hypothetical protein [Gemmatimonadota bacterium]